MSKCLGWFTIGMSLCLAANSSATDVDLSGIKLKPGERIVAIDGVPVDGSGAKVTGKPAKSVAQPAAKKTTKKTTKSESTDSDQASQKSSPESDNIVGTLVRSGQPFSHTPGESALEKANYERRRNGVGDLVPDPALQQLALKKAKIAAARGIKNHIGGSLGGARAEGVGHTQGRFLSCCLDMPARFGGAAMVKGADGWYCCLLVR